MKTAERFLFIDSLRAFLIFLVVMDHVAQAYGLYSGGSWFVKDFTRGLFYDGIHLVVDTFHMALLFLLAGLFIIPSVSRRGILNFMKERILKLGVPFVFGVLFLVPPQTYYKFLQDQGKEGYLAYLKDHFFKVDWYYSTFLETDYPRFTGDLTSSGFWFLPFLLMVTLVAILLWKAWPFSMRLLGKAAQWVMDNPLKGYVLVSFLSFVLISGAELFWGARFSLSWGKVFWVRGNLFPLYLLYFSFGIGLSQAGYMDGKKEWVARLSHQWKPWTLWTCLLGTAYTWYCIAYYEEGAFSYDILLYFYRGGTWEDALPILQEVGPLTWIRTALHGFFYTAVTVTLLALFARFLNRDSRFWASLAATSFGIYIFHEPLCVWIVYVLAETDLPDLLKFLVAGIGGYTLCWVVLSKVLLKIPFIHRIIR